MAVVDLGASPGSWSQVAAARIGRRGKIVAADLLSIEPLEGVIALQMDVCAAGATERIRNCLGSMGAHVVLNDMAPNTSGVAAVDHLRSLMLCEVGLDIAKGVLLPGGTLLSKVFMGGQEADFRRNLKLHFGQVCMLKPASSRKESREIYIAGINFLPQHSSALKVQTSCDL